MPSPIVVAFGLVALLSQGRFLMPSGGAQEPSNPAEQRPLTIGESLRLAFFQNPDLLNSQDALFSAQIAEVSVKSNYQPQVTPFFAGLQSSATGFQSSGYGVRASQQFSFGPLLQASAVVTRSPPGFPDYFYGSDYLVTLTQPLLRGADPAVTREPLYLAGRVTEGTSRAYEVQRRQTVLLIYRLYLGLAQAQGSVNIATERLEEAHKLTEFSRARFLAGSVSRLDVLRSEQQEASAEVDRINAQNSVSDLRDQLRRATGLIPSFQFSITAPEALPMGGPMEAEAEAGVAGRRPEAVEAAELVQDAQLAVRIAKSLQLPSLNGVLSYEALGNGASIGGAFPIKSSSFLFGFSSDYNLNTTALAAQTRQAELDLTVKSRNLQVLIQDLTLQVRQAYRELDAARRNHEVAAENLKVAELQVKVARLRFEKGLAGNFDAVDADNLLNSTLLLELASRYNILLAELDCLYASGYLKVSDFLEQP